MASFHIYRDNNFRQDFSWDSSFRIVFLLKGKLQFLAGMTERQLYSHDLTFIKPFEIYGAFSPAEDSEAFVIEILPELLESICPNINKLHFTLNVMKANENMKAYRSICKALAQIAFYHSVSRSSSSAHICRAISDILTILIEDFTDQEYTTYTSDQTAYRIQNIIQYINENYSRRFSLEEIANAIGFHPQYFSTYFKKQFGTSFTDYLNNYRISKSIPLLRETQDSILNIALACGFNNHKTFSNAFEKIYHCSPRDYRKQLRSESKPEELSLEEEGFDYLRRFWNSAEAAEFSVRTAQNTCSIVIKEENHCPLNQSHTMISIGRAISCLRSDLRSQLTQAKKDLDLEFVRIRDIFSDDLFVFYEDENKTPVYSWRALDEIFDFLVSLHVKPFIEIGYMPEQLASKKQYAGWQYHPNISAPKSLRRWGHLVSSFINHLLQRYGSDPVETWLFDFWTSPNLDVQLGYWNESKETFFEFYETTWQSVKSCNPRLQFGTPNFSYPSGLEWYDNFFDCAKRNNTLPDFISIHLYGCNDGQKENAKNHFMQYSVFSNNYTIPKLKPERKSIPLALDALRELAKSKGLRELPIVVDDWNVTFFPTDYTRDTCFMAPYVLENYFSTYKKVFGMGFASLSDIHEDFFNTDQIYNGGPGLLTYNGIPKASYHALSMAYRFTRNLLQTESNYVVGKTPNGYELLIFNMDYYNDSYIGNDPAIISFNQRYNVFEGIHDLNCHIELVAQKGIWHITRSALNRENGSSYDAWLKMGSPGIFMPEISNYLKNISIPKMKYETIRMEADGMIYLDEVLPPHGVLHVKIEHS